MEKGVALVIRKAKVPIIPVAIDGSFEAWPKGTKIFRPHPIRLLYGPPMDLADKRPDEIVATIDRTIRGLFEQLPVPSPNGSRVRPAQPAYAGRDRRAGGGSPQGRLCRPRPPSALISRSQDPLPYRCPPPGDHLYATAALDGPARWITSKRLNPTSPHQPRKSAPE